MSEYVRAKGFSAITIHSGVFTRIPLLAINGDLSWINANGGFVCQAPGVYHFDATGYTGKEKTRVDLLDVTGLSVGRIAYSGANGGTNALISGFEQLDLAAGDEVYLGLYQASGVDATLTAADAAALCKMSVRLLEAYS